MVFLVVFCIFVVLLFVGVLGCGVKGSNEVVSEFVELEVVDLFVVNFDGVIVENGFDVLLVSDFFMVGIVVYFE